MSNSNILKEPNIRFSSFKGEWLEENISYFVERYVDPVTVEKEKIYKEIGVRSHAKGIFHKEPTTGKDIGKKRVFWVHPNAFIVNIVFAWEQAIALTSKSETGYIASHRFPMFLPKEDRVDLDFFLYFFKRKRGQYLLQFASPGGAGRNKTLGQKEFASLKVTFPSLAEQKKIAEFLLSVDRKLELLKEKLELTLKYKKGLVQKFYRQDIRVTKPCGESYGCWSNLELKEILQYEQPTKYLVKKADYSSDYKTPVLTAGKSFILGYTNESGAYEAPLPVIIFDDFTTATKFVDFPFKGKSSAMKILKPRDGVKISLRVVFEFMKLIKLPANEHKRYWISELQHKSMNLPSYPEQLRIEKIILAMDERIFNLERQIFELNRFKNGLYQKLFV